MLGLDIVLRAAHRIFVGRGENTVGDLATQADLEYVEFLALRQPRRRQLGAEEETVDALVLSEKQVPVLVFEIIGDSSAPGGLSGPENFSRRKFGNESDQNAGGTVEHFRVPPG
jgi:hypothetical protein